MITRQPERFGPFTRHQVTYRIEITATPFDLVSLLVAAGQAGAQVTVLEGSAADKSVWVRDGGQVCSDGPAGAPRRLVYQVQFNHTAAQIEACLATVRAYGGSVTSET